LRGEFIALGAGDRVWVDVLAFEHRASAALDDPQTLGQPQARTRLKRALALYSGDLLRERDSEALVIERERLRTLYLDAAYALAGAEAHAENWPAARDLAQRLCAAEPLREDAQRLLMTAHVNCGSRALAIRQYHLLTAILFKELGVAPMPETIALAEQIGARRVFSNPVTTEHIAPPALPMREAMLQVRGDLSRMLSLVDHALAAE
jgi:DNA-binding SARP family transcriptional activator